MEPYILTFARFREGRGKDILEIGVGMGADHLSWAQSCPRSLIGIDLTMRAVAHTHELLGLHRYTPHVHVADAETLPFEDASFDIVYSWGVIHHSPDTYRAARELLRVLRPGGVGRVMIYNRHSIVGLVLWIRYGLLAGRPWIALDEIYSRYLESPGTKAYTVDEAGKLFSGAAEVRVQTQLSFGDLLQGSVGQRHQGVLLRLARALWPRAFIRRFLGKRGLYLLIEVAR